MRQALSHAFLAMISPGRHSDNVDGPIYNLAAAMSTFPYVDLSPSARGRDDASTR